MFAHTKPSMSRTQKTSSGGNGAQKSSNNYQSAWTSVHRQRNSGLSDSRKKVSYLGKDGLEASGILVPLSLVLFVCRCCLLYLMSVYPTLYYFVFLWIVPNESLKLTYRSLLYYELNLRTSIVQTRTNDLHWLIWLGTAPIRVIRKTWVG